MRAGGGAGGARRLAASPSARLSEAHLHGPITRTQLTATGTRLTATGIRRTATVIRRITAIATAIRRTTATATGTISVTTAHVTNERLPAAMKEQGRENPVQSFVCAPSRRELRTQLVGWVERAHAREPHPRRRDVDVSLALNPSYALRSEASVSKGEGASQRSTDNYVLTGWPEGPRSHCRATSRSGRSALWRRTIQARSSPSVRQLPAAPSRSPCSKSFSTRAC